jgi:hypothetical protein
MLDVKTSFLTPGWSEWKREFLALGPIMQAAAPNDEEGWGCVGERATNGWMWVTVQREMATRVMSGWTVRIGAKPNTWCYERVYSLGDPTPEEVATEVAKLLKLRLSQVTP